MTLSTELQSTALTLNFKQPQRFRKKRFFLGLCVHVIKPCCVCTPLSPQTDLDLVTRGLNMAKVAQRRSEKVVPGRSPGLHFRILAKGGIL